ncbi:MAG: hypothetical protein V1819_01365 [bacterium]
MERESVIAFGLTFKNLAIMAGLGFILFVLYYVLPKVVFVLLAIIFGGSFLAATFIKVGGQTLPQIIFHSFGFLLGGRVYVWNKTRATSPVSLVQKKVKKVEKKEAPLKMAPQSRLSSLGARLDFSSQKEEPQ